MKHTSPSRGLPLADFQPRQILVRGVNWLGDAVMTTPALMRLREKIPAAHIVMFCSEKLGDFWKHHPAVNGTITFAANESLLSIRRKLRAQEFDAAVVFPNSPRSALEVWLAGVPCRVGYARPWRNWLLTKAVASHTGSVKMRKRTTAEIKALISDDVNHQGDSSNRARAFPAEAHQIHEYLHLVAVLGADPSPIAPRLEVTEGEIQSVAAKLGLPPGSAHKRTFIGLNPGAEYGAAKRWPVEKFIVAAREIQRRSNCTLLIFGGKADVPVSARIHSALNAPQSSILNLAGRTTLRELMALLKVCRVLITNDTGPMHVAAALNTPVVVPFGSTSPELTGPGLPGDPRNRLIRSTVPCAPCFLRDCPIDFRCMNGISAEHVVAAVMEVLSAPAAGSPC